MADYSRLKNLRSWSNAGPGISAHALIAPVEWFTPNTGIKSPVAPFTVLGDAVSIKDAHEFIVGKGFIYFALAPEKNQLAATVVGDRGFNKQNQEATIYVPGNNPALHEQMQTLINVPLIVLVKDANCSAGLYMQLGSACEGAFLGGEFNTDNTKGAAKGYNLKVTYDGPVMFYTPATAPEILAD